MFYRLVATVLIHMLFVVSVLSDVPSPSERDAVLEYHTAKRGNVTPTAANMKMMVRCPHVFLNQRGIRESVG